MANIEIIKRDKIKALETMQQELTWIKNSIDDYKKLIQKEIYDEEDVIHLRDAYKWIQTHYEKAMDARTEAIEKKAYLLAYKDVVTGQTKI